MHAALLHTAVLLVPEPPAAVLEPVGVFLPGCPDSNYPGGGQCWPAGSANHQAVTVAATSNAKHKAVPVAVPQGVSASSDTGKSTQREQLPWMGVVQGH
ncbi:hypothetical protein HaLaN_11085 [Haematococcus lacustris]|uniref:Secreted protein n=1 Tax=Haematococcus lacustris TaxID=44745 RepID=A0A699ZH55_HAELA|nr:hypothetical protein HaLaN_11085 [Haematococcus lacustris]